MPNVRLGNGAIDFEDSLIPVPWYFRVNLGTEDSSVLTHPRQREGLRVLEMCYEKRIINSAA